MGWILGWGSLQLCQSLVNGLYIDIFTDNDNPTVVSDMVSKNIFSAPKFWTNIEN